MELQEFSNKNYKHGINRKKLSALINFSESLDSFKDWQALEYITNWLEQEFLDSEGERFLDHLLTKYGINYLDWSCKSYWVKEQIRHLRKNQRAFVSNKPHKIFQLDMFAKEKDSLLVGREESPQDIVMKNNTETSL